MNLKAGLLVVLFLLTATNTNAESPDCWNEFSEIKPICDQAVITNSQSLLDQCDQANNRLQVCLGLDKEPWTLQSSQPGHLNCEEWKQFMIAGTAQNCPLPIWTENELRCLSSAAEAKQVRSHPVDYILDFDPNSCLPTEADLKQFPVVRPLRQKSPGPFNIFGINPYQTWLNLKELAKARSFMGTGALDRFAESTILHGVGVEPYWERDARQEKEFKDLLANPEIWEQEENITIVNGQGQFVDQIFTGRTAEMVTVRFTWGEGSKALINVSPKTEIKFSESAVKLNQGELEVKVKKADPKNTFEVQTDFVDLMVIGTHFWIKSDPGRRITQIDVYEGKVEIKTKDGQSATITPNGDQPGRAVVTQKLSLAKRVLIGSGLIMVILAALVILLKTSARRRPKTR